MLVYCICFSITGCLVTNLTTSQYFLQLTEILRGSSTGILDPSILLGKLGMLLGEIGLLNHHLGWPRRVGRYDLPRYWGALYLSLQILSEFSLPPSNVKRSQMMQEPSAEADTAWEKNTNSQWWDKSPLHLPFWRLPKKNCWLQKITSKTYQKTYLINR